MTFWYGSRIRASDLWIRILLFLVTDLQDADKKLFFSAYYFLKVHFHHISKIKVIKKSQKCRDQGFYYYVYLMIEGSGAGSVPLTNGSGSPGGPKTYGSCGSGSATLIRKTCWRTLDYW